MFLFISYIKFPIWQLMGDSFSKNETQAVETITHRTQNNIIQIFWTKRCVNKRKYEKNNSKKLRNTMWYCYLDVQKFMRGIHKIHLNDLRKFILCCLAYIDKFSFWNEHKHYFKWRNEVYLPEFQKLDFLYLFCDHCIFARFKLCP